MMFSAICGSVSTVISCGFVIDKSPSLRTAFADNRQGITHADDGWIDDHEASYFDVHIAAGREAPSRLPVGSVRKVQCRSGPHQCQDLGDLCIQSIKSPGL